MNSTSVPPQAPREKKAQPFSRSPFTAISSQLEIAREQQAKDNRRYRAFLGGSMLALLLLILFGLLVLLP